MFQRFKNRVNQPESFDNRYGSIAKGAIYVPGPELVMINIAPEERDDWERQLQIPPIPGEVRESEYQQSPTNIIDRAKENIMDTAMVLLRRKYVCNTGACKELGGVVVELSGHYHPCPLEADQCDAPLCNKTGICRA